jgi:hypothetical protein
MFWNAGGYMGVEALGFGGISPVQNTLAIAGLNPAFTAETASQNQAECPCNTGQ